MRKRQIILLAGLIFNLWILYSFSSPLPPSFLSAVNHQDGVVPLYWFKPGLLGEEIFYDDEEMVLGGYVTPDWNENAFAVKFTVLDTPFVLLKSKVFIDKNDLSPDSAGDKNSPFEITVHLDSNGVPGRLISGPIFTAAEPDNWEEKGQWVETIHNSLITKNTDFWIVFHWLEQTPTAPLVGQSNNQENMRSFWGRKEEGVYGWHLWPDYDYMIRAEILTNLSDSSTANPLPDSFKIYRSTDSTLLSALLVTTLPGNQFQYWDSAVVNGTDYFYAVTALASGQESPPSDTVSTRPLAKAQISLSQPLLEVALNSVAETTLSITLNNTGQLPLYYNINTFLKDDVGDIISDEFGYTWKGSDMDSVVNYEWVEIEERGWVIAEGVWDNENWGPYALGFPLPFYGNIFDSVRITTKGWVSFTSGKTDFKNKTLPNDSAVFNLIAPFWDDLIMDSSSKITYLSNSDSAIITYSEVRRHPSGGPYTFQIILTKAGQIVFQYKTISDDSGSTTVGIQNQDGSIGLQIGYNKDFIHGSLAIQINPSWIKVAPRRGEVKGGESQILDLHLQSNFLTKGMYSGDLVFKNWDENQVFPNKILPITLLVDTVTAVKENPVRTAVNFTLSQNYPNPFNQGTIIQYSLAKSSQVELVIYNLLGQKVRQLINEIQTAGHKKVFWDGLDEDGKKVGSGIYFYQLKIGDIKETKKMLLLK